MQSNNNHDKRDLQNLDDKELNDFFNNLDDILSSIPQLEQNNEDNNSVANLTNDANLNLTTVSSQPIITSKENNLNENSMSALTNSQNYASNQADILLLNRNKLFAIERNNNQHPNHTPNINSKNYLCNDQIIGQNTIQSQISPMSFYLPKNSLVSPDAVNNSTSSSILINTNTNPNIRNKNPSIYYQQAKNYSSLSINRNEDSSFTKQPYRMNNLNKKTSIEIEREICAVEVSLPKCLENFINENKISGNK